MSKSKYTVNDSLWSAVGYAFSCGLNVGAAVAMFSIKKFWPMVICIGLMIFTAWMADANFQDVKKVLDKQDKPKPTVGEQK